MDGFKKQLVKGLSKKNVGIPGEESSNQLALAGNDDPEQIYDMLVSSRKTHFSEEELARLLAAFKRVAKNNRLQGTHFYEIVANEMGWSNLLLRKQLFSAFDRSGRGDINFEEFAMGYSALLRGTVPELLDFAWRIYHVEGPQDLVSVADMYTVLRFALGGLEEVRRKQGKAAGGPSEDTRFPDRTARHLLDRVFGETSLVSRSEFNRAVLRHRRLVDCLIPGFELVPQDPLHAAAAAGEVREVQHLIEVDQLDPDGRDGKQFPTTPLHLACRFGHPDVVRLLLSSGANPRILSAEGETALELCIKNMRNRALEALMETPMDLTLKNAAGQTALHAASRCGNTRALRLLLPHFASCPSVAALKDDSGDNPLHAAAAGDHFLAIDVFLEFGMLHPPPQSAEIDEKGAMGRTAAHIAAESRAYRVLKRLMELGCSTSALDGLGRTLLASASRTPNNEGVYELLLEEGRQGVNQVDHEDVSPLNAAVETRDLKMIRMLLERGADANSAAGGSLLTPLHRAVLLNWQEGVEALLAPGYDCELRRDALGCSPLDYARTAEITGLLREYVESRYSEVTPDHPVSFDFALVVDEGLWRRAPPGLDTEEDEDAHNLHAEQVSDRVRRKRIEHKLLDPTSLIRELRAAGLVVMSERVLLQERVAGVRVGVRQHHVIRVGAPLYRLQLEAMRMRLRVKRRHLDGSAGESEEFFIDQATYPETAFEPYSRAERQKILMHVIEGENEDMQDVPDVGTAKVAELERRLGEAPSIGSAAAATTVGSTGGDLSTVTQLRQIKSAGVKLAYYLRYGVLKDFIVLHNPDERVAVLRAWRLGNLGSPSFWYEQLMVMTTQRRAQYSFLEPIKEYFGHKFGFYTAFIMFYTNFLIAPAVAGLAVYGLLYIQRRPETMVTTAKDQLKYRKFYDHPLAFAYAGFLILWGSLMVRNWIVKQKELAYRWKVDDSFFDAHSPNPQSTAKVQHLFINGRWEYKAVETLSQYRRKLAFVAGVTAPVFVLFIGLVLGCQYLCIRIIMWEDKHTSLFYDYGTGNERRNPKGFAALYFATALSATFVWLLNWLWGKVVLPLNNAENHPTMNEFQMYLTVKLLAFQAINTLITPLYFAYWVKDLDKVGAQLGSLLVVGAVLQNITEYLFPFMIGKGARPKGSQAEEREKDKERAFFGSRAHNKVAPASDLEAGDGSSNGGPKGKGKGKGQVSIQEAIVQVGKMASEANLEADNKLAHTEQARRRGAELETEEQDLGAEIDFRNFREARTEMRFELLAEVADTTVEMAEMVMQYTLIVMFGGVWPLCGVTAIIFNFFEVRLDLWKFCVINRRPLAEIGNTLGRQWTLALDMATLAGIGNHSFMLFVCSTTLKEYFFDKKHLDTYYRVFLAFIAQTGFLLVFLALRLTADSDPLWIVQARKDALRYVRDAYRAGQQVRERRRQLMAQRQSSGPGGSYVAPNVPLPLVAGVLDLDIESVNRYLVVTRYLESLTSPERRALLADPHATVQGLIQKLELLRATGQWRDQGEPSTMAALERTLVPVTDIGRSYRFGRRFRELCYTAAHRISQSTHSMDAEARSRLVLGIRQAAAVELDITLPQAERYCKVVRYVDSLPGNPYKVIDQLKESFKGGVADLLRDAKSRGWEDTREPSPFQLGPVIEPEMSTRKACTKAAIVRRRIYDLWVKDQHLLHDELVERVAEEMGGLKEQLERYMLVRRYADSLDPSRRKELLDMAQTDTLTLCREIRRLVSEGQWRDAGELPPEEFDQEAEDAMIVEYELGGHKGEGGDE